MEIDNYEGISLIWASETDVELSINQLITNTGAGSWSFASHHHGCDKIVLSATVVASAAHSLELVRLCLASGVKGINNACHHLNCHMICSSVASLR